MQAKNQVAAKGENNIDKRAARTRKALEDALCELAREKPVLKITVAELAARADISRGTFYLHYSDIWDLYTQIEDYTVEKTEAYFEMFLKGFKNINYSQFLMRGLDYIEKNRKKFEMLFGMRSFRERLASCLSNFYLGVWRKFYDKELEGSKWKYLLPYHTSGSLACVEKWLNDDEPCTKEELLDLILMIDEGFDKMVGSNRL